MIETEQTIAVSAPIGQVWSYVRDIRNWAELMPGLQGCEILNEDDSRWVLKVGVGALVRTVKVNVHVEHWDGPGHAAFSFRLNGDPVEGSGTYRATADGASSTGMTLALCVVGTGPMAPMWEAMAGPLLPKFARAFTQQLADGIELATHAAGAIHPQGLEQAMPFRKSWLQRLWRAIVAPRNPEVGHDRAGRV